MEFKVGDVVRLKSSGPKMTIVAIDNQSQYICKWFWENEVKVGTFPKDALEKVE